MGGETRPCPEYGKRTIRPTQSRCGACSARAYRERNPDALKRQTERQKERYHTDPAFRERKLAAQRRTGERRRPEPIPAGSPTGACQDCGAPVGDRILRCEPCKKKAKVAAERRRKLEQERLATLDEKARARAQHAAYMRKRREDPSYRAQQAERFRQRMADPEFAARQREKARAIAQARLARDPGYAERVRMRRERQERRARIEAEVSAFDLPTEEHQRRVAEKVFDDLFERYQQQWAAKEAEGTLTAEAVPKISGPLGPKRWRRSVLPSDLRPANVRRGRDVRQRRGVEVAVPPQPTLAGSCPLCARDLVRMVDGLVVCPSFRCPGPLAG